MNTSGILCAFVAAFLQALAYNLSTWAIRRSGRLNAVGLMVNAGILMGILSLFALPFVCDRDFFSGFWGRFPCLALLVSCYIVAQILVFIAQRKVDASQLVPLLGLKLPILACLSAFLGTESFNRWRILAVILTALAAFVLNNAGKRIPLSSLVLILLGCFFYCCSDLMIREEVRLIQEQTGASSLLASAQTTFWSYLLVGIAGAVTLCLMKSQRSGQALAFSAPYAAVWLVSIVFLTIGFTELGTVNGNIIQSTRGIITVLMAPFLIGLGMTWLESKTTFLMLLRRFLAAAMMIAAVILYNHA